MVVVDTSIIIDHLRTEGSDPNTKLRKLKTDGEELVFSLISVGELFSGKSALKDEEKIEIALSLGETVKLDYLLLREAGVIRSGVADFDLEDAIIAATALRLDLPVATLNIKDFKKVKGLKIYKAS